MKKTLFWLLASAMLVCLGSCGSGGMKFETTHMDVVIANDGNIVKLADKEGNNYMPVGAKSPVMRLYLGEAYALPVSAVYDEPSSVLTVTFDNGSVATIATEAKGDYLRMQLTGLEGRDGVQAVAWGPYNTSISEQIGETVCVVRDSTFAIGLQGLDINTTEGLAELGDDAGGGCYIDPLPGQSLPDELKDKVGEQTAMANVNVDGDMPAWMRMYRGSAAVKNQTGSELRLFSRDRRVARDITNYQGAVQYVEPVDVDFIGSAVALFGCPEPQTLDLLEVVELGEGLPHPIIDGVWVKRWNGADQAYMFYEGEDIAAAMQYADSCNFKLLHIGDIFKSWGHFELESPRFPKGSPELLALAANAKERDIRLGVHTLTMFTQTRDPYVSPVPSDSLCKVGSSVLAKDLGASDDVIYIKDPKYFKIPGLTRTVKVGKELVAYRAVSDDEPYRLVDCVRGQFGTKVSAHKAGDQIDKIVNDDYSGFFPDHNLQDTYAIRLANVCKESGMGLMDFDGYGGGSPTGRGTYDAGKFIDLWYKTLAEYPITCGAGTFHYYWHIYTFMNWGEPWYDNLRASQVNYRLENQRYFERNLMPNMLGWFKLEQTYRPEDVEWIQARSAAFDAGYLLRVDEGIEVNGFRSRLFEAIREWQKARNAEAFSAEQLERMKVPTNEFHLEKTGEGSWNLYDVNLKGGFEHKFRLVQSGEPLVSKFKFDNIYAVQPVQFYVNIDGEGGSISNLVLDINSFQPIKIEGELRADDRVWSDGKAIYVCDKFWKTKRSYPLAKTPMWDKGENTVVASCDFSGATSPVISVEFKSYSEPQAVKAK